MKGEGVVRLVGRDSRVEEEGERDLRLREEVIAVDSSRRRFNGACLDQAKSTVPIQRRGSA